MIKLNTLNQSLMLVQIKLYGTKDYFTLVGAFEQSEKI